MFAPSPAVRRLAGGVRRHTATAPSDASERASGKKRPPVAPTRDSSSACLTKMTRNRNSFVTAAGEMSSQELLQKRLASELDALHGLLKKAELISKRGACKGGAPTAGEMERFLASNQRPKPTQEDFDVPSVKMRKISMRPDKFSEESKDEKLAEESKDDKVAEESKGEVVREQKEEEYADISGGLSRTIETGSKPSSSSSGDSDAKVQVQQSTEAKKVQDAQQRGAPKPVDMPGLLYRANLRRQLLEMERAALPDQSVEPRDLQRLGIKEYGHPSLMRQLGLVLKVDA